MDRFVMRRAIPGLHDIRPTLRIERCCIEPVLAATAPVSPLLQADVERVADDHLDHRRGV